MDTVQSAIAPRANPTDLFRAEVVRLHYKDIAYCVEWHDRMWPDEARSRNVNVTPQTRKKTSSCHRD